MSFVQINKLNRFLKLWSISNTTSSLMSSSVRTSRRPTGKSQVTKWDKPQNEDHKWLPEKMNQPCTCCCFRLRGVSISQARKFPPRASSWALASRYVCNTFFSVQSCSSHTNLDPNHNHLQRFLSKSARNFLLVPSCCEARIISSLFSNITYRQASQRHFMQHEAKCNSMDITFRAPRSWTQMNMRYLQLHV